MKKIVIKAVSILLCLGVAISCFSVFASAEKITYLKGANDISSAYKDSKYYKNLTQIELTGDGVTDTLAVALSQLEYVGEQARRALAELRAAAEIIPSIAVITVRARLMRGARLMFHSAFSSQERIPAPQSRLSGVIFTARDGIRI